MDKPAESLAARLQRRRDEAAQDAVVAASVALPMPVNTDVATWPKQALLWLLRAGCGVPEIRRIGAYFNERTGRVVIPVMADGQVVYWQARSVDGRQPKYLNPLVDRSNLVAKYGGGPEIVLTEDILSAFRIGAVTEAWSLLGTKLHERILAQLIADKRPVVIWLDGDRAGLTAMRKIRSRLAACGIPVRVVKSLRDPKLYSRNDIERHLNVQGRTDCQLT